LSLNLCSSLKMILWLLWYDYFKKFFRKKQEFFTCRRKTSPPNPPFHFMERGSP
jgi:hypothetical protein